MADPARQERSQDQQEVPRQEELTTKRNQNPEGLSLDEIEKIRFEKGHELLTGKKLEYDKEIEKDTSHFKDTIASWWNKTKSIFGRSKEKGGQEEISKLEEKADVLKAEYQKKAEAAVAPEPLPDNVIDLQAERAKRAGVPAVAEKPPKIEATGGTPADTIKQAKSLLETSARQEGAPTSGLRTILGALDRQYETLAQQVAAEGEKESETQRENLRKGVNAPPISEAGKQLNEIVRLTQAVRMELSKAAPPKQPQTRMLVEESRADKEPSAPSVQAEPKAGGEGLKRGERIKEMGARVDAAMAGEDEAAAMSAVDSLAAEEAARVTPAETTSAPAESAADDVAEADILSEEQAAPKKAKKGPPPSPKPESEVEEADIVGEEPAVPEAAPTEAGPAVAEGKEDTEKVLSAAYEKARDKFAMQRDEYMKSLEKELSSGDRKIMRKAVDPTVRHYFKEADRLGKMSDAEVARYLANQAGLGAEAFQTLYKSDQIPEIRTFLVRNSEDEAEFFRDLPSRLSRGAQEAPAASTAAVEETETVPERSAAAIEAKPELASNPQERADAVFETFSEDAVEAATAAFLKDPKLVAKKASKVSYIDFVKLFVAAGGISQESSGALLQEFSQDPKVFDAVRKIFAESVESAAPAPKKAPKKPKKKA